MSYVLAFFLGFLLIVFIHELGHFIAAKKLGIKVLEFSIFIGPRIYSFKRGETTYSIRLLPILAYVKLEGEEEAADGPDAYYKKPKYARILTSAGGPLANLLLAVVLLTVVFAFQGIESMKIDALDPKSPAIGADIKPGDTITRYDGKRVYIPLDVFTFMMIDKGAPANVELKRGNATINTTIKPQKIPATTSYKLGVGFKAASGSGSNSVASITPGYPAEAAGLKAGDRIVRLDDMAISSRDDIVNFMNKNGGKQVTITVRRGSDELSADLLPKAEKIPEQYDLGLYFAPVSKGTLFEAFKYSITYSYSMVRSVGYSLVWLVTRKAALNQMMGPIGMVSTMGSVVQQAPDLMDKLLSLFRITGILSIAVGATNLIPFPMLDGNKILLVLIEAVRGKPIPIEKEAYISMVGFVLLILFAIYAAYNDIVRLVTG